MTEVSRAENSRAGLVYGLSAYGLWGVLPIYFVLLAPTGPIEVVAWRIVWSLVFCGLLLLVTRNHGLKHALRSRRGVLMLGLAALVIYINWQLFVWSVATNRVIDASLGYFINPLVTVLLGIVILRERITRTQAIAVCIGALAIIVMAVGAGGIPWISLALAASFGVYSLIKHEVGATFDAVTGMTIETAWITPIAIGVLGVLAGSGGLVFGHHGGLNVVLLLLAGPVTACPLLLFAAAARRLPLVSIGLIQFVSPILQFLFGLLVLHEAMPLGRWIGFALVWVSLAFIVFDMTRGARAPHAS